MTPTWAHLALSCLAVALVTGFVCYWIGFVDGETQWRLKHGGRR